MPRIPEHPNAASRSRAPTGKNSKPPAAGPPPKNELKGSRERVRQAAGYVPVATPGGAPEPGEDSPQAKNPQQRRDAAPRQHK